MNLVLNALMLAFGVAIVVTACLVVARGAESAVLVLVPVALPLIGFSARDGIALVKRRRDLR